MTQYTNMLAVGMESIGHQIEIWEPKPFLLNSKLPDSLKKWLGYFNQFVLFPYKVKKRLKGYPDDTLFVFIDNALGPWVPLVQDRPHVIHCHDFMAQKSGLGFITENHTGFTGRLYQRIIRNGYLMGRNFISVSEKTKEDLHQFLNSEPLISEVVYNGINKIFKPLDSLKIRQLLTDKFIVDLNHGYLFHIGGNLWYKNRRGVLEIYNEWKSINKSRLPLLLVGEKANEELAEKINQSIYKNDIHVLSEIDNDTLHQLYAGASLLLFPSLEEGFGWPIAEAMACGCPVITTNVAPMTEVGGNAAFYIPRRPIDENEVKAWSVEAAGIIEKILTLDEHDRRENIEAGASNVVKFDLDENLKRIEDVYKRVIAMKQQ